MALGQYWSPPSPLPASSSPSSSSRVSEKRDNRYFNEKSTSTTLPQYYYSQYWSPPSSSQGFQSSISISIRISIKISISISISISITHPLLICFCIPPNSLCYGENGRPRDEDTLRRVYSLVPMSLSIKKKMYIAINAQSYILA